LVFCFILTLLLLNLKFLILDFSCPVDSLSSYECGFDPMCSSHSIFCIKFFLLAIIFLVFDVEVAFLVPGLKSAIFLFSFTIILTLGLLYEFCYGGLD